VFLFLLLFLHGDAVGRVALLEERALVVAELGVERALLVMEVANQVEQVCVLLHTRGKLSLRARVLAFGLLDLLYGLLLGVVVLGHEVHHHRRRTAHLERVQVYEISEAKELFLFVVALLLVAHLC